MASSMAFTYTIAAIGAMHSAGVGDNDPALAYSWRYRTLAYKLLRKELDRGTNSVIMFANIILLGMTEASLFVRFNHVEY